MSRDNISMIEAKRIARANGYKTGEVLSEFQIISIVSAAHAAGFRAATERKRPDPVGNGVLFANADK